MKALTDYPLPETDSLTAADFHLIEDDYVPSSVFWRINLHARSLEGRLAACREALQTLESKNCVNGIGRDIISDALSLTSHLTELKK